MKWDNPLATSENRLRDGLALVVLIHIWLQPGDQGCVCFGNRLNGFRLIRLGHLAEATGE